MKEMKKLWRSFGEAFEIAKGEDRQQIGLRRVLPRLRQLVNEQGVTRSILSKDPSAATDRLLVTPHKDIVLHVEGSNQSYMLVSLSDPNQSLMIADYRATEGRISRAMIFERSSIIASIRRKKVGNTITYEDGKITLSKEEQIALISEVENSQLDEQATQELSKTAHTF